ncbi:MAG TPA: hypothetical protein VNI01_11570 [Elusimicrobiota bacterium]|jgi:hypothetical protein|nr:hypothetical protein [Elusimicrobiota bacterium]
MAEKTFRVRMSDRCFRFKPDALGSHAPRIPGVYEFVTFNDGKPEVLYVGLALSGGLGTIHDALAAHMMGQAKPTSQELFAAAKDVYFDYVAAADVASEDEFKDIAGFFLKKNSPRLNAPGETFASGKHAAVSVQEVD